MRFSEEFSDSYRKAVTQHAFFQRIRERDLNRAQVAYVLGQFWHPVHYFPTFLSSLLTVAPTLKLKTYISKILFHELGEGDPKRSHSVLYLQSMATAGFSSREISVSPHNPETQHLMQFFDRSASNHLAGLGFLYCLEVVHLAMVSGISQAVRRVSGEVALPWEAIHVVLESDSVGCAHSALETIILESKKERIIQSAHQGWVLWAAFFDGLNNRMRYLATPSNMATKTASAH